MKTKTRKRLQVSVFIGGAISVIILLGYFTEPTPATLPEIAAEFTRFLCCCGIAFAAALPLAGVAALVLMFLDRSTIRTACVLGAHRLSARVAARNAATIYPCMQYFLFFVLTQNKEILKLPLGKDPSCLTPSGYSPAYRSGCVFYRFQMIAPEKPDMELSMLRQVIQSLLVGEMQNYGIHGLPSVFHSKVIGSMYTVFLDRVYYDEGQHYLGFDVLYIDSEDAAMYARSAVSREAMTQRPEMEVTDADL